MNNSGLKEPQILCPNCGCLSPIGAKRCDCGYILKRSAAPYIIAFSILAILLVFSVAWVAYFAGQLNPAPEPMAVVESSSPSPEPEEQVEPSPVPTVIPLRIDLLGLYYHDASTGLVHAREHCPKLTGEYTSGYFNGKFSPDFAPCSTCIKMEPEAISNGEILDYPYDVDSLAPLTVEASDNASYYIFLKCVGSPRNFTTINERLEFMTTADSRDMAFYVAAGKSVDIVVPLGKYEIYYACGNIWYGTNYKFGAYTTFHKCDGIFEFYDDGEYYQGWTLELYEQENGNLDSEEISADEFPG